MKKAQFYIFTAILLSAYVFMIYANSIVMADKPSTTFTDLNNNFVIEGPKVVNNAIYNKIDVETQFEDFVAKFIDYTKTRNINFGIFYMLINNKEIFMVNNLDDDIIITTNETKSLSKNKNLTINTTKFIIASYNNINYTFTTSNDPFHIQSLVVAKKGNTIKIFVNT